LPRGGNAVPVAVLLLRGTQSDASAVVENANRSLSEYQRIREWLVWPEEDFPRTSTEKPRTDVLLKAAVAHFDGPAAAGPGSAAAVHTGSVAALAARITRRPGAALSSLNSLERVELMSAMEDRFHVDLNESKFTEATTIQDLEEMLRKPQVGRTDFPYPRWAARWPITWIRPAVYHLLTWPLTQLLAMPRIRGRERLRGVTGPVLVVCNHVTYLDIGLILAALPARLRRVAVAMEGERVGRMRRPPKDWPWIERLVSRVSYWLMTPLFHVFPLPQRAGFRESFRFAGEAADKGYSVAVFPEGVRTPDGNVHPFRGGIGLLAANLRLPVVPMRIHGLWELKVSGRRGFAPWGAIGVHIGDPIRFPPDKDPEAIARELESAVRSL
jgi:long-chain acyl-CoA synthetase